MLIDMVAMCPPCHHQTPRIPRRRFLLALGAVVAARAGFNPDASISLWEKMGRASDNGGPGFLSTHPSGPDRIQRLRENVPRRERQLRWRFLRAVWGGA